MATVLRNVDPISPPALLSPSLPWRVAYQKGRSMPPAGPLREGSPKMNGRMGRAPTSAGTRGETPLSNGVGAGVGAGGAGAGAAVPANPNAAAASAPKATVNVANFFMANLPSVGSGKESLGTRTPAIRLPCTFCTSSIRFLDILGSTLRTSGETRLRAAACDIAPSAVAS